MTKIYIYCIFVNNDVLYGVYSSIKSAHRDAIKLSNKGSSSVYINHEGKSMQPTLTLLRNIFKGGIDIKVSYFTDSEKITILKTKLRE